MNMTGKYFFISFLLLTVSSCLYAQMSVRDDYKKELWNIVNPNQGEIKSPSSFQEYAKPADAENKYLKAHDKAKYGSLTELPKVPEYPYRINPIIYTYYGDIPLNQLPSNATRAVYMGGHFHIIPIGGTSVIPSGINLSGWSPKRLSDKSRFVLKTVFDMEFD